jgi:hypothetical protein
VIDKLATSLKRRDETPNQELAQSIADRGDRIAVNELVDNLSNRNKKIQSDCIKVLYEIGERKPGLISDKAKEFVGLLGSENNRLVWGAMTALDSITLKNPEAIYTALPTIIRVSNSASVIARDHAVSILTKMATLGKYKKTAFKLLIDQLKSCPTNQLPMYAENAIQVVDIDNKKIFRDTLSSRLKGVEKLSKRRRVEQVIKKVDRSTPP